MRHPAVVGKALIMSATLPAHNRLVVPTMSTSTEPQVPHGHGGVVPGGRLASGTKSSRVEGQSLPVANVPGCGGALDERRCIRRPRAGAARRKAVNKAQNRMQHPYGPTIRLADWTGPCCRRSAGTKVCAGNAHVCRYGCFRRLLNTVTVGRASRSTVSKTPQPHRR